MPRARFLAPWHEPERIERLRGCKKFDEEEVAGVVGRPAIYHCVSRVVDRRFVFGDREKEKFVALMGRQAEFSQVRVLAFCVMSNHFHILVEVSIPPPERGRDWSDERLLDHLSCLYGPRELAEIRWQLELLRRQKADKAAEEYRDKFFARMWDLSVFMKELKQAFSRWFNKAHERRGTLWEERFKSVLAEDGHASQVMAAYIDLNPVRAGMVADPKDYRWSSYGQAVAGKQRAREGINRLMLGNQAGGGEAQPSWRAVARRYREVLCAPVREEVSGKADPEATPGMAQALAGSVRQFTEGLAVGRAPFLELTFSLAPDRFGPRRRTGARRMRGIRTDLHAMRDLQPDRDQR